MKLMYCGLALTGEGMCFRRNPKTQVMASISSYPRFTKPTPTHGTQRPQDFMLPRRGNTNAKNCVCVCVRDLRSKQRDWSSFSQQRERTTCTLVITHPNRSHRSHRDMRNPRAPNRRKKPTNPRHVLLPPPHPYDFLTGCRQEGKPQSSPFYLKVEFSCVRLSSGSLP